MKTATVKIGTGKFSPNLPEFTKLKQKAIVFNLGDNVATALVELKTGEVVELNAGDTKLTIKLVDPVPYGHKFSLATLAVDSPVIKYGEIIGKATAAIHPGDYVHVHNVASDRARGDMVGGAH